MRHMPFPKPITPAHSDHLGCIVATIIRDRLQAVGLCCTEITYDIDWHSWYTNYCRGNLRDSFAFELRGAKGNARPPISYMYRVKCDESACTLFIPGTFYKAYELDAPTFPDNMIAELCKLTSQDGSWFQRLKCRLLHNHSFLGCRDLFDHELHLWVCSECLLFFRSGLLRVDSDRRLPRYIVARDSDEICRNWPANG